MPLAPCPQAAGQRGTPPAGLQPLLMAVDVSPPTPEDPPEWDAAAVTLGPLDGVRLPFRLPAWGGLEAAWWTTLIRSTYGTDATLVRDCAAWAQPVLRDFWLQQANPPVVGHYFAEYADCTVCVVPGTLNFTEMREYLGAQWCETIATDPDDGWSTCNVWYNRGRYLEDALRTFNPPATKPVLTIGHSAGVCSAATLALRLTRWRLPSVHTAGFGGPQWGTSSIASLVYERKPQILELSRPGDPISELPPAPWVRITFRGAVQRAIPIVPAPQPRVYQRITTLRDLVGARGLMPHQDSTLSAIRYSIQAIIDGALVNTPHALARYNDDAYVWAFNEATLAGNGDSLAGLSALINRCAAAGL